MWSHEPEIKIEGGGEESGAIEEQRKVITFANCRKSL